MHNFPLQRSYVFSDYASANCSVVKQNTRNLTSLMISLCFSRNSRSVNEETKEGELNLAAIYLQRYDIAIEARYRLLLNVAVNQNVSELLSTPGIGKYCFLLSAFRYPVHSARYNVLWNWLLETNEKRTRPSTIYIEGPYNICPQPRWW